MARFSALFLLASQMGVSQPVAIGAGPELPFPILLAPGQVTYLYARIDKTVPNVKAEGYPLPLALQGVSVWIGLTEPMRRMPLFSVEPMYPCRGREPVWDCDPIAAIRVQVPVEFFTVDTNSQLVEAGRVWIEVDGKRSIPIAFSVRHNNPEFLTLCGPVSRKDIGRCPPEIWHADGTPVSSRRARPGDVLIVYAYGLGLTFPTPPSGEPAPASTESSRFFQWLQPMRMILDFRANAKVTTRPGPQSALVVVEPKFAGLVPGLAGLYQINFVLPEPPLPLTPCPQVASNVTLSFPLLLEGISFCIETGP